MARRLENKPFHLIATHRQGRPKKDVVALIKGYELPADTPNFSVTNGGRHPQVKGNGYVPYYLIFDHTGRLAYHHMCGAYHGGNGLKMIEQVDELLKKAPYLYLGNEPFKKIKVLAERASRKKKLASVIKEVEKRLSSQGGDTDPETRAELERLLAAMTDYRDRRLKAIAADIGRDPRRVVPALAELDKELRGTKLGKTVAEELDKQKQSKELQRAIGILKEYDKILKKLEGLRPCKKCKRQGHGFRPGCADCLTPRKRVVSKEVAKLQKLKEQAKDLPVAGRIEGTIKEFSR